MPLKTPCSAEQEMVLSNEPETKYRTPTKTRRGAWVTQYEDGVQVTRYDDGQYKVGRWDSKLVVDDLRNFERGGTRSSGYVKLHFD
jgi:hypothetical protein